MSLLALVLFLVAQDARPVEPIEPAKPEEAVRTFYVAMVTHDEAILRAVTLPHDELDQLVKWLRKPAVSRETARTRIARFTFRALKPGDVITLPNGDRKTIKPDDVGADRAIVVSPNVDHTAYLKKIDGRWRVDPSPLIAEAKANAGKKLPRFRIGLAGS